MTAPTRRTSLVGPAAAAAAMHAGAVALLLSFRTPALLPPPPIYKVNIVAAAAGPQRTGMVAPAESPPETAPRPVPLPTRAEKEPPAAALPTPVRKQRKAPAAATPTTAPRRKGRQPAAVAPEAAGGPEGGRGADVANVRTEGIEFPYPGYLNNIVRQIALNFHPGTRNASLRADIAFLIHRDGTISNVRFVTRSGVYGFDLEAQGALEVAKANFGPLPEGFRDDVLPVTFSFDPRILR